MSAYKKDDSRKIARERYWSEHDKQRYQCPDCGRRHGEVKGTFEVHHKNGSPYDNRMDNLIGLCGLCHALREDKHPSKKRVRRLIERKGANNAVKGTDQEVNVAAVLSEFEERVLEWFEENQEKQMSRLRDSLDIDGEIPDRRMQPQTRREVMVHHSASKRMLETVLDISEAVMKDAKED